MITYQTPTSHALLGHCKHCLSLSQVPADLIANVEHSSTESYNQPHHHHSVEILHIPSTEIPQIPQMPINVFE